MRDPMAAPLQRVQIIKGWSVDGAAEEAVYDVACSDGAQPSIPRRTAARTTAPASISPTCQISADSGADELKTMWTDPAFDPDHRAVYYVRVLENPTCRWSTWDAIRAGVEPRRNVSPTIQERAWSSPIWYVP